MKKIISKYFIYPLIILSLMMLASCGYEPVFYGIMHDVAPEKATVSSFITNIARCSVDGTEYLFLTGNGTLKYKRLDSANHGEWNTYSGLPFSLHSFDYFENEHEGQYIFRVISDQTNIYLLSATVQTDTKYGIVLPARFYLWSRPLDGIITNSSGSWVNVAQGKEKEFFVTQYDTEAGEFKTFFDVFYTNTPQAKNRKAWLRVTKTSDGNTVDEYYELNGQNAPEKKDLSGSNYIATNANNTRINSAFYIGSTLYFTDSLAVTTDETEAADATYACLAGAYSNNSSGENLYTYEGSGDPELLIKVGSSISSLAMTKDSILIGKGSYYSSHTTDGGIERILRKEDGKPANVLAEFDNNAKYQFTSAYILMTLLCADPRKTEAQASLYATISYKGTGSSTSANPKDVGLWSYYPGRGNWNRE